MKNFGKKKKIPNFYYFLSSISLLIGMFFVVSSQVFPVVNAATWADASYRASTFADYNNDGVVNNQDGDGSSGNPYKIATASQLGYLSYLVNTNGTYVNYYTKHYQLIQNIDLEGLNWSPIGTLYAFRGNFNGNGYSINGMSIDSNQTQLGLFSSLTNATVSNLILSGNIKSTSANAEVGGLAGRVTDSTISGIASNVNIVANTTNASNGVGGLIGSLSSSTIAQSYNNGNVKSKNWTGGIYGYSVNSNSTINNVYNSGTIESEKNAGGIAGELATNSIEYVYNYGAVVAAEYAGGIAAYGASINYAYNYGNITSTITAGGIFAQTYNSTAEQTMQNVVNSGVITGTNGVGGILGRFYLSAQYTIENALNLGNINGKNSAGSVVGDAVGGIVGGRLNADVSASNAYNNKRIISKASNKGVILGRDGVGGIVGALKIDPRTTQGSYAAVSIKQSYNEGSVTGNNYVGGITGITTTVTKSRTEISYDWWDVLKLNPISKTVYYEYGGDISIDISYNTAAISGYSYVGGISGQLSYNDNEGAFSLVSAVYNTGSIVARGTAKAYIGGVIGDYYKRGSTYNLILTFSLSGASNPNKIVGTSNGNGISNYDDYIKNVSNMISSINGLNEYLSGGPYWSSSSNDDGYPKLINAIYSASTITDNYSSSIWASGNNSINNGKPYLKNFYW